MSSICFFSSSIAALVASVMIQRNEVSITSWGQAWILNLPFFVLLFFSVVCWCVHCVSRRRQNTKQRPCTRSMISFWETLQTHRKDFRLQLCMQVGDTLLSDAAFGRRPLISDSTNVLQMSYKRLCCFGKREGRRAIEVCWNIWQAQRHEYLVSKCVQPARES